MTKKKKALLKRGIATVAAPPSETRVRKVKQQVIKPLRQILEESVHMCVHASTVT
jgi:hypothetical protein